MDEIGLKIFRHASRPNFCANIATSYVLAPPGGLKLIGREHQGSRNSQLFDD